MITESTFEHEMDTKDAYQSTHGESFPLAEPLEAFNVYTFDALEVLGDGCSLESRSVPYGFSVIQQLPWQ